MKAFNASIFFLLTIFLQIVKVLGIINKCKRWNNWSECKNNFIVRDCISDNSLHEAKDCENCGKWTEWSLCENGKQHRHLTNCQHIRDKRKCDKNDNHTKKNINEHESDVELAGAVKSSNVSQPSFIHNKSDSGTSINAYDFNSNGTESVAVEDQSEYDENYDTEKNQEASLKSVDTETENEEDDSYYSHRAPQIENVEHKNIMERSHIEENQNDTEGYLNIQNEEDELRNKIFKSSPEISKHNILQEAGNKIMSLFSSSETKSKLESNPALEPETQNEELSTHDSKENVISKTSLTGSNASQEESKNESKDESKDRSKEDTKKGFGENITKTHVASGIFASVFLGGGILAYAYSQKKKKDAESENESKGEKYEVIFNENEKVDNSKNMYEEEFWGYE